MRRFSRRIAALFNEESNKIWAENNHSDAKGKFKHALKPHNMDSDQNASRRKFLVQVSQVTGAVMSISFLSNCASGENEPAPLGKSVGLISPSTGDRLVPTVDTAITWDSQVIKRLRLEYSTDGGQTWIGISTNADATVGAFTWSVPNEPSSVCHIRATDVEDASVSAESGQFGIRSAVFIQVGNIPELGETGGIKVFEDGELSGFGKTAVVNEGNGSFRMLDMTCTHQACDTFWLDDSNEFACPCHGSRFAKNGDVLTGPASRPLSGSEAAYNSSTGELIVLTD
jgi:Rieske Fe-S protein